VVIRKVNAITECPWPRRSTRRQLRRPAVGKRDPGICSHGGGTRLLEACGLIALLVGVSLVGRFPALSRRQISPTPGFALHPGRKMPATRSRRDEEEPVMGVAKKAKHKAKAVKSKTKKDAGKVKHKGKKAKNAAKH
jgi:hypothetical protein